MWNISLSAFGYFNHFNYDIWIHSKKNERGEPTRTESLVSKDWNCILFQYPNLWHIAAIFSREGAIRLYNVPYHITLIWMLCWFSKCLKFHITFPCSKVAFWCSYHRHLEIYFPQLLGSTATEIICNVFQQAENAYIYFQGSVWKLIVWEI